MPRFFSDNISDNTAIISGEDARHIGRSLRMKLGEEITVCSNGIDYFTKIESISDTEVVCNILKSEASKSEPNIKLTLYQAMPKLDKLETVIQKSVELGVYRIVPVITKRCISRPSKEDFKKKLPRLSKISLEASKQSGRGIIPEVSEIITFDECLKEMSKDDYKLISYEKGGKRLNDIGLTKGSSISVLIGSEGGFDEDEAKKCQEVGIIPIWLGERILRCETAPDAVISIIMNLTENM